METIDPGHEDPPRSEISPARHKEESERACDLTGRDRMTRNVLTSWGGHMVVVVSGFVMPRLIDGHLGRSSLGAWDFAWSLVTHFTLITVGLSGAISRFVAKFRSTDDMDGVNRAVNSCFWPLIVASLIIGCASLGLMAVIPQLLSDRLSGQVVEVQWVVLLLGVAIAFQVSGGAFGGIVTGCHRWDIQNALVAGMHIFDTAGMILMLLLGRGLVGMALVILLGQSTRTLALFIGVRALLPELRFHYSLARLKTFKNMLGFGGKALLPKVGEMVSNQTTAVLIVAYLGAPALALYARPRSLLRHVRTLLMKFAMVLTPTASSLQATKGKKEIGDFLCTGISYGSAIALPAVATLSIMGGPLLRLWMGPEYEMTILPVALALGHLAFLIQIPAVCILIGLNAHGRAGLANLVASVSGCLLVGFALGIMDGGLIAVALGLGVASTIINGIYIPVYACQKVGVPLRRYVWKSLIFPGILVLPFGCPLFVCRMVFVDMPIVSLLLGLSIGGILLMTTYWMFLIPASMKIRIKKLFRLKCVHSVRAVI